MGKATKKNKKQRFDMPSPIEGGVPWLVYPDKGTRGGKQKFYSIVDSSVDERCNKLLQYSSCRASAYGWMLIQTYIPPSIFLFNPSSSQQYSLPNFVGESPNLFLILSDPKKGDCFIVGINKKEDHPCFWYTSLGEKSWRKHKFSNIWASPDSFILESVCCNGKVIYLLTSEFDLVVIQFSPLPMVEKFGTKLPNKYCQTRTFVNYNLVASSGDLFLVENMGYTSRLSKTMMISKLDFSTMTWYPTKTIDESVFLLSNYGAASFMGASTKLKGNCIYYVWDNVLYCFDLEYRSFTVSYPLSDADYNECSYFWLMPDLGTQNQKINHTTKEARNLSVSYEKFQFDHPRFLSLSRQSTCSITQGSKFWERCSPGIPWLMFTHEEDGIYKLLDPCTKSVYELLVPGLSGLMLLASFDGWLFAHANCHDFFFINPFSREKITLPISSQNPFSVGISASPTGPECRVFFVSQSFYDKTIVQISIYQLGDDKWTNHEFEGSTSFKLAHSNSVYLNGCFYSLGVNGNLGVYDLTQDSVRVLRSPLHIDREACFGSLVESSGKLLSIYFDFYERPIGIFEFDTTFCRWKRVMNMGDRTFFYGRGASFVSLRLMNQIINEKHDLSFLLSKKDAVLTLQRILYRPSKV